MKIFDDITKVTKEFHNAVVALGNFDGVHIGHQEIIKAVIARAKQNKCPAGLITFYPHPASVLNKSKDFRYLLTLEEKLDKLQNFGLDFCVVINFTEDFAKISAKDFIFDYLCDKLHVSHILTGSNFRFGHKREGDAPMLAEYAKRLGYKYQVIDKVDYNHMEASSSAIKELLIMGRLGRANSMLGAPYAITGMVEKGSGKAKEVLATPTANIKLPNDKIQPIFGVYMVRVIMGDQIKFGVANIGIKPTFGDNYPGLEVNIFDHTEDIYGHKLTIELLRFIRPELKFSSVELLKYHIDMDIISAKYLIRSLDTWLGFKLRA